MCGGIFLYESCANGKVVIVPHSWSLRDVLKRVFPLAMHRPGAAE